MCVRASEDRVKREPTAINENLPGKAVNGIDRKKPQYFDMQVNKCKHRVFSVAATACKMQATCQQRQVYMFVWICFCGFLHLSVTLYYTVCE